MEDNAYPNVTYIDGSGILDNISLLASGLIHPNIYGVQQIADRLFKEFIKFE